MSKKIPFSQVVENANLNSLTTWKLGGKADRLYRPRSIEDLQAFLKTLPKDEPITWLGLGSNVLIRDGGIRGTIILTQGGLSQLECDGELIYAQAGVASSQVARFAAKHNLTGGEFLAGVPGSIGGALVMNAGAHEGETWRFVDSVTTINRDGELIERSPEDFNPQYRQVDGLGKDEWFVSAQFRFIEGDGLESMQKIKDLLKRRSDTQPANEPCCGSVFRNPPGNFSAKLIEGCGLKNFRIGAMQVSDKHANFVINRGGATAKDAETIIKTIQEKVFESHGIKLKTEVKFIGEPLPDSKFGKVGVLMGGTTGEREISLRSGKAVLSALKKQGIDAHPIDVGDDLIAQLQQANYDRLFNVLHGPIGEDGTINGLLHFMKIPVTGSGMLGSALSMDKLRAKQILKASGLPTPPFMKVEAHTSPDELAELGFPLAIKPIFEGSSLGVTKVKSFEQIAPAIARARQYGEVMAESWIEGAELHVGIVGERVLPSVCVETEREFYDYDAKYVVDSTKYHCPSHLSDAKEAEVAALALSAYNALGASGWGRVDVMQDMQGHFWLIEFNPAPGMTERSLVPKAAKVIGWSYEQLVCEILAQTLAAKMSADREREEFA